MVESVHILGPENLRQDPISIIDYRNEIPYLHLTKLQKIVWKLSTAK